MGMGNEFSHENCSDNPSSNLHCPHKTFFAEMTKRETGTKYCCWCGGTKKEVIPTHGPFYHSSCVSTT